MLNLFLLIPKEDSMSSIIQLLSYYFLSLHSPDSILTNFEKSIVWEYYVYNRAYEFTGSMQSTTDNETPTDSSVVKEFDSIKNISNKNDTVIIDFHTTIYESTNNNFREPEFSDIIADSQSTRIKVYVDQNAKIEVMLNDVSVSATIVSNNIEKIQYNDVPLNLHTASFDNSYSTTVRDTLLLIENIAIIKGSHHTSQINGGATGHYWGDGSNISFQLISFNGHSFKPEEIKYSTAAVLKPSGQSKQITGRLLNSLSMTTFDLRGRKMSSGSKNLNGCFIFNNRVFTELNGRCNAR